MQFILKEKNKYFIFSLDERKIMKIKFFGILSLEYTFYFLPTLVIYNNPWANDYQIRLAWLKWAISIWVEK